MLAQMPIFVTVRGQPVVVLGHGETAAAKARLVERSGGIVLDDLAEGIDKGARIAFVAHDDAAMVEGDAIRARCAGLLVNAADRPELCDFTLPSILDRAPVLVAIGTGGASAGLAKQLRLRLEALLPRSLGALADALYAARTALRERWPEAGDRRRALDAALGHGGPLDPLAEGSAEAVADWLEGKAAGHESRTHESRTVEIVLRSPDPDDLTLREMRWLGAADRIAHEPAVPLAVLEVSRADAARIALPAAPLAPNAAAPDAPGLTVTIRAGRSG